LRVSNCSSFEANACLSLNGLESYFKPTACIDSGSPAPVSGLWHSQYPNTTCAGDFSSMSQFSPGACTAGFPPYGLAGKTVCTSNGSQIWMYSSSDCAGSVAYVVDVWPTSAGGAGVCSAGRVGVKYSCFGAPVAALPDGLQSGPPNS
jgi:hypothetical protein